MSRPDAEASAALDGDIIRPVFFCFLDIAGDPLRACTAGKSIQLAGTGDPDIEGYTFDGLNPTFVSISGVQQKDGGAPSVTAKLSGMRALDNDLLNLIGDRANWQGRTGRLWRVIRDKDRVQHGAIQHYYTGWMTALNITGAPDAQTIDLTIDSYLAAYTQASNRTYLDQELYDPGDLSARAAIALANGVTGNPLISNTPTTPVSPGFGRGINPIGRYF